MIRKLGLNPSDPDDVKTSLDVFMEKGLVTQINKPGEAPNLIWLTSQST